MVTDFYAQPRTLKLYNVELANVALKDDTGRALILKRSKSLRVQDYDCRLSTFGAWAVCERVDAD